jgi:hypothetical protein
MHPTKVDLNAPTMKISNIHIQRSILCLMEQHKENHRQYNTNTSVTVLIVFFAFNVVSTSTTPNLW